MATPIANGLIGNPKSVLQAVREPKGSVIEQLYSVEERVNEVIKKLDDLDVHMTPALGPASPECAECNPAPEATCELDSRLRVVKLRLENIIYRLADLNARVQF